MHVNWKISMIYVFCFITSFHEDDPDTDELDELDAEDEGGLGHGVLAIVSVVPRGKVGALLEDLAGHRKCHDGNFPRGLKLCKVQQGQFLS